MKIVIKSRRFLAALAVSSALLPVGSAFADDFTNGGFETGDLSGWTTAGGYWQGGSIPAAITGPANSVTVVSQGNDPLTGLPMVYAGNYAVRVNDSNNNFSVNSIAQSVTNYSSSDLYLAWSAVMAPGHAPADAGSFNIVVTDTTTNTSLANIHYDASTGNPNLSQWSGTYPVYSGWVVEHLSTTIGDNYTIQLIANDCDAGGHYGYVYLDAFSNQVVAPNQGVNAGASSGGVIFSGGGGAPAIPDIVTASGNSVSGLGTATTRRFDGGTLTASDDTGNFTISANGGFIDAHGANSTFSGAFSDDGAAPGHLTITDSTGGGVVVLTGANTHSGGTTVLAGATLQIPDAAALGTGTLSLIGTPTLAATLGVTGNTTITNNVTVSGDPIIDVASGVTTTISGVISDDPAGPGDVVKTGDGTLVLSGANTYSGGTIVRTGTLQAGAINTLPVGQSVAVETNGTLDLAGYDQSISTLSGDGAATLGSANLELSNASSTFAGVISGSGAVNVTGGTEVLTGNNTYTGGTTIGSGATLALGSGGTSGTIAGNVVDNGALVVNRSDALTLGGNISGQGSLGKTGTGTLTLTGTNTYAGGTTVSGGTLKGNTTSLQGAITDNAAVEFAQTTNGTYAGAMTGTGSLTKSGTGTLTLTGSSSIAGATTISAGKLALQGRLGTSTATVGSTATLGGTGTLAGNLVVNSGGTLAPGNSPGTLTVTGNATLNAGANFITEIDGRTYSAAGGSGSYDRLALSGANSTFNAGGTISPVLRGISGAATNAFTPAYGDKFTVVTAAAIGSGAFSSVVQPASGMPTNARFDVLYNPQNVQLVLTPGSFRALGLSDGWLLNGINAAAGLDAVRPQAGARGGNLPSLFNGLYGLDRSQLGLAFQQISGEIHADALQAEAANVDLMRSAVDSVDAGLTSGGADKPNLWTQILGRTAVAGQDAYATRYTDTASGFMAGLNFVHGQDAFGLAGGYLDGKVRNAIGSQANSTYGSMYLHGTKQLTAGLSLKASIGYAFGNTTTSRSLTLSTGTSSSTSRSHFSSFNGDVKLRYEMLVAGKLKSHVFAGLIYNDLSYGPVQEVNGTDQSLALSLGSGKWKTVQSTVGGDMAFGLGKHAEFVVSAAWNHELDNTPTATRLVAMGPASWTVNAVNASGESLSVGANLAVHLSDRLTAGIGYQGTFDTQRYSAHRGSFALGLKF